METSRPSTDKDCILCDKGFASISNRSFISSIKFILNALNETFPPPKKVDMFVKPSFLAKLLATTLCESMQETMSLKKPCVSTKQCSMFYKLCLHIAHLEKTIRKKNKDVSINNGLKKAFKKIVDSIKHSKAKFTIPNSDNIFNRLKKGTGKFRIQKPNTLSPTRPKRNKKVCILNSYKKDRLEYDSQKDSSFEEDPLEYFYDDFLSDCLEGRKN